MVPMKTITEWMTEKGIGLAALVEASGLDNSVVQAIADCRYTPSPEQRRRISSALGVAPEEVVWGHRAQIVHIYGHGAQFGRSP